MKTIVLMRHARARNGSQDDDKKRSLTAEGVESAHCISNNLLLSGCYPSKIISSDAKRSIETAKILSLSTGNSTADIEIIPEWYDSLTAEILFAYLEKLPDTVADVAIIGHNPGLEKTILSILPEFTHKVSPASAAIIGFNIDSWSGIRSSAPSLIGFKIPSSSEEFKELKTQIFTSLAGEFEDIIMKKVNVLPWSTGKRFEHHVSIFSQRIAEKALKTMRVITVNAK